MNLLIKISSVVVCAGRMPSDKFAKNKIQHQKCEYLKIFKLTFNLHVFQEFQALRCPMKCGGFAIS